MKFKRMLSLFTALTMIMGMVSFTSFAEGGTKLGGKCGENVEWFINSDADLVIHGSGNLDKELDASWPWDSYAGDIQKVIVEEGITELGSVRQNELGNNRPNQSAFTNCKNIKEAIFSSTVTNLNVCLSGHMSELKDVWIYSKNIENTFKGSIASYPKTGSGTKWHVYQNSTTEKSLRDGLSLTDDDIEYITADQNFPVIENRTPIELPEVTDTSGSCGLTTIYEWNELSKTLTFSGKGSISITDNYYEKYKDVAEHIVIEPGITFINASSGVYSGDYSIMPGAFYDFTALKDVDLPDTIKVIGEGAFCNCSSLTSLISGLPEGLQEVGDAAFSNTSLSGDLSFPKSVIKIGKLSFNETNLTYVKLNEGMDFGGKSFYLCNSLKEVIIPSNIFFGSSPSSNAPRPNAGFAECTSLEKVLIQGVGKANVALSIKENAIGEDLFYGCTSLKEIIIDCKDVEYVAEAEYNTAGVQQGGTFWLGNNPTFYIYKDSTTEQTLRDAGYLTEENTVYIADFSKLETAISDAEAVETDKYTDESVSAFNEALEAGKAILEDKTSTQDEVDNAVKAIEDAKNALEEKEEPSSDPSSSSDPSDSSSNPSDSSNPSGSGQSEPSNSGSSQPTSAQPATNAPTTATPKVTPPTATTVVKPAKVKAVKLKAKKKKLNVSWKKVSGATGYEVKAATNSKFTKGKKTVTVKKNKVTIKNLKPKKKYFVKVRAYKLANGRKYYGKWSKVVKKKVR